MPRDKFEVVIIHLGGLPSDETASKIHARADQVVALPNNVSVSLLQLQQLDLDILYFPEIGMDAQTYTLAYSRIAPVQLCGWGHPVTPGLQTLDGFLSTIDEVSDAETHYTEPLIRLPRLAVWYERPARPASPSRIRLGLPEFSNIYVCPQTLFKFHPEFDTALRAILEYDKSGRLVLIEGRQSAWIEMLKSRFRKTMGECYNRIIWIPPLSREQFLELLAVSDVMLDPFPYCGGNTSYEAIAMGTPVVTYPTSMLRGRLTTALYRQMGIHDLVANSVEHYVHIATRLCFEPDYRLSQVEELNQRCEVLFHDNEAVSALMAFFETAFHGRIPT